MNEYKLNLEKKCSECDGAGETYAGNDGFHVCRSCEGTGCVLTEMGEDICSFLHRCMRRFEYRDN